MKPPVPRLEWISTATVAVAPVEIIGRSPAGERRVVAIREGRFEGHICGNVVSGGADFQIVTTDGTSYLDARYLIRTDDNALIIVQNRGIRHGVIGDDPSQYYFRSTPQFETGHERYLWLNKIVAVCSGARTPETVLLDFYQVL